MRIAREEIFGPVLSVLTFRTPDEAVAKANNTPYGLSAGVWTEKGSRILGMAAALRAGVVWANTFNRFDPTAASAATRSPASAGRAGRSGLAAYLDTDDEPRCGRDVEPVDSSGTSPPTKLRARCRRLGRGAGRVSGTRIGHLAVTKTYKLYVGGAFPRSESGRTYPAPTAPADVPGQRRAGLPQGRPGRRGRGPQGLRRLVEGDRLQPRPGDLPDRRDAGGAARRSSSTCSAAARPSEAAAEVDAAIDRLVHYAGWTDKLAAVFGGANPVAGPFFSFSTPGADRGGRGDRAAAGRRCSGWCR